MRGRRVFLALGLLLVCAPIAAAQQPRPVAPSRAIRAAFDTLRLTNEWTLEQQRTICQIPAPPFKEAQRAEEYRRRFEALGLAIRVDSIGNVIATRPGRRRKPVVVVSAHLDTVFPEGTDVTVHREGSVMRGPGIADDCRGLALLLAVARAMDAARVRTGGTILFVGTVGEEGLGNLRGVRHLLERELPGEVDYFLSVDLSDFQLSPRAVGSHRYKVTFSGPGGHSFGDFGIPNPAHAAGRAIATIADIPVPAIPRTTFSVGVMEAGTSVNAIAARASFMVDLRSESPGALDSLDRSFRGAVRQALAQEAARWPTSSVALMVAIDTLGIRPAGATPDSSGLLRAARDAARALGIPLGDPLANSTDANLPISLGIPAMAIGHGGKGTGEHSLSESYDDGERGWLGPQWVLLMVTLLAGS